MADINLDNILVRVKQYHSEVFKFANKYKSLKRLRHFEKPISMIKDLYDYKRLENSPENILRLLHDFYQANNEFKHCAKQLGHNKFQPAKSVCHEASVFIQSTRTKYINKAR